MNGKEGRLTLTKWLGLLPALTVLAVLFAGALVFAAVQSFGHAPQYGVTEFPTLKYYRGVLGDDGFWVSLGITFYYALVPTVLGGALSLALALSLSRRFRGKALALFLYRIPMVVPYLVGVSLAILLFANGGLFARLFHALGVIATPADFPRLIQTSGGVGIMMVYLWKQVPFMTAMLYANLIVIGRQPEEAATLLGASPWQTFRHVTLPRLMPALVGSTLIVFAFNFGAFEVPFILGAGYPNTLTVEAWRLFDNPDYSQRPAAMAIVCLLTLISAVCVLLYLMLSRRFDRTVGRAA
ncbi:ABC transporter permease [Sneathiella chinensis]|uniref:ABC transporter permease n=1 Tax=Sneathiella chinensis TaxID=349750 RepID=A0ABQ5U377_9PROT|nr:ABC transporter permease subunit [Sneathiella chinensis]GLQ06647.1 ABC transporter permease [Sneathiella chinensis]